MLPNGLRATELTIDWISTTKREIHGVYQYASHPSLHDWENWQDDKGRLGYTQGSKHGTGVQAFFNSNRKDMGIHVIYSGKALQKMEQITGINGYEVMQYHIEQGHTIARVDLALDFKNCGLTVQSFENEYMYGFATTRLKTASVLKSLTHDGHTLYIGSRKARKKLVRVYDKGAERGLKGADWTRVEIQLMGKPATQAGIVMSNNDARESCMSIIKSVIDFPNIPIWRKIFNDVSLVKIGSQSSEKGDTRDWLEKQCIPSLVKEIMLDREYWVQFSDEVFRRFNYMTKEGEDKNG